MKPALWLFAAAACAMPTLAAMGQEEASPGDKDRIAAALKLTSAEADKYDFHWASSQAAAADARFARQPEPLLRWSNPAQGEIHGNVYLWTMNGRPAVVGSLFKWFSPHTHMSHEFHSLTEQPLVGEYERNQVWQTSEGGVHFAPLEDAPRPAAGSAPRLLQMRGLAREFTAVRIDRDGNSQELRLLTQPLYRYAAAAQRYAGGKEDLLDGALFVFVQGTDPELFLLVEGRGRDDSLQYFFAAARMNGVGLKLRRGDREVFAVEPLSTREIYGHAEVYTSFMFKDVPNP